MENPRKGRGRPTILPGVDDALSRLATLGSMHCMQKSASWLTQRGPAKAFVMRAAKSSYVAGEKLAKCDENLAQACDDAQFVGQLAGISGGRTWSDLEALRVSFSIGATASSCLM